jgi:hypothetical protein
MENAVFCNVTVVVVNADVSEDIIAPFIRAKRRESHCHVVLISLFFPTLTVGAIVSFDTSVLATATRHHIPEDGIPHKYMTLRNGDMSTH